MNKFSKTNALLFIAAFILGAANFANACSDDEASNSPEPRKIASTANSCNFNCSENSDNSADFKVCLRLQAKCEKTSGAPASKPNKK